MARGQIVGDQSGLLKILFQIQYRKPFWISLGWRRTARNPLAIALLACSRIGATWAASHWWGDPAHYHPAYVLYGLLGLLWVAIPSVLAVIREVDMPFPTLFRTIENLEEALANRWPRRLGPMLSHFVTYVIWAGLTILLLHLTLYPFPDITKILNPNG